MKFVALVSGGKDSFYSIMECIRNGHELLACAHLSPRQKNRTTTEGGEEEEEEESYMYQTAASETIPTLVEECLGVPLIVRQCVGGSKNTSLVYDHEQHEQHGQHHENQDDHTEHTNTEANNSVQDEVEDLYELLIEVQSKFPSVQGISSGAILSTYQRTRIESVCARLDLTPLGYLWRSGKQRDLLECMLKDGIEAVLVKVASPPGLLPQKHLNKTLGQLFYGGVFDRLKDRFDFHICGEGGEYETLVLDCPLFQKRLDLSEVEILETDDGVGILQIMKCCAVEKDATKGWDIKGNLLHQRLPSDDSKSEEEVVAMEMTLTESATKSTPQFCALPQVKILNDGLAHVSEIYSQNVFQISDLEKVDLQMIDHEAELAVLEAKCIFETLQMTLSQLDWSLHGYGGDMNEKSASAKDVVFVHLYLSSISHFTKINTYYQQFFGKVLPPSRSCVAVGQNTLPGGRRVMLDCIVQRGSGAYMRIQPETNLDTLPKNNAIFIREQKMNPHHKLRSTLHVQTISHWAPICVGPYSQANTLRSGVVFLAGQIGLVPATMKLVEGGWAKELSQCWKNAARVLDALEGSLKDILGGVVYICSDVLSDDCQIWEVAQHISRGAIKQNGNVIAGEIDDKKLNDVEKFGGYEDYETWAEMTGSKQNHEDIDATENENDDVPLLMVALPQMPKGALSEVELICATSKAAECLAMENCHSCSLEENISKKEEAPSEQKRWDMGYDGVHNEKRGLLYNHHEEIQIESVARSIGKGCSVISNTVAYFKTRTISDAGMNAPFNFISLLQDMMDSAIDSIEGKSGIDKSFTLHIRLFFVSSTVNNCGIDALALRCALRSVISSKWSQVCGGGRVKSMDMNHIPACSVVPVDAIFLSKLPSLEASRDTSPVLGMQIIALDLIHLQTEMWLHSNRTYS